jgi:hypothetical protein
MQIAIVYPAMKYKYVCFKFLRRILNLAIKYDNKTERSVYCMFLGRYTLYRYKIQQEVLIFHVFYTQYSKKINKIKI